MERSHQLVVLVLQKVAMIDVPGVLNQLIFRSTEVGVAASFVNQIFRFSPPNPQHHDSSICEKRNFLPPPVLRRPTFVGDRTTYVLVITLTASILVVLDSFSLVGKFLKYIKADNRRVVLVGGVLRKGLIENGLCLFIKDINSHRLDT